MTARNEFELRLATTQYKEFKFFIIAEYLVYMYPIFDEVIVTDPDIGVMHFKYEDRKHLRIPQVLKRIDVSGVLFFLGILLVINSLEIIGVLKTVALWLDVHISNLSIISMIIGLLSAIIDNVPLVAASIGMYDLAVYPTDSALWNMIAYCAGTGGSIFIIGSAAGVAFMGIEKVDFIWYMKKVSLTAFAGFLAGMALYLLLSLIPI